MRISRLSKSLMLGLKKSLNRCQRDLVTGVGDKVGFVHVLPYLITTIPFSISLRHVRYMARMITQQSNLIIFASLRRS